MERAISPSPTPSCSMNAGRPSAARPQQRSLVAERRTSSYRLFPIVDPTPPASPVTLQKAAITKHRRRSSSLDHHHVTKEPIAASGHARLLTSALRLRDSNVNNVRKGSLPDIRPIHGVREEPSNDVSAKLQALPPRPHTAVDRALEGSVDDGRSNSVTGESQSSLREDRIGKDEENRALAVHGRGFNPPSTPAVRPGRRVRSKPNLRINVAADHDGDERPPPPPPKSPRHTRDGSNESRLHSATQRHHATTTAHVRDDSDPPIAPSVAQQQSLVSLSPTLKVREFTVSPGARGRKTATKMHDLFPSDFMDAKPLPPTGPSLQAPSSKFSDPSARPSTSDGVRDVSNVWRGSSIPPPQRQPPPTPLELRSADQGISRLTRMMRSSSRDANGKDHDVRPGSPEVRPLASHPVKADWSELPMFAARPAPGQRTITPEPQVGRSDGLGYKGHHTLGSRSKSSNNLRDATTDYMPPESLSKASLALATARANVAALRSSNPISNGSPGSERRSRSSGSDIGDGLPRRPSTPATTDPIETLKDLSEQVEALHTKYAGLKAERQKISSSIINTLKAPNFGSESANIILDEQLSLAAISSSMDICFAKLKSLECRKEDAIAALIAKTTQSQKNPADNISAMIASMALTRKASLAPSIDSASRFAPTGRSTPDLGDNSSMHRLTQPSTRTFSYGSEPESLDYRVSSLSRKHSNGGESIVHEGVERQTPAMIPEGSEGSPRSQRVSRIHDSFSAIERTSDVSALSPVFESHNRASLSEAALEAIDDTAEAEHAERSSDTVEARQPVSSPTSDRSMSPEDLLEGPPKKIRVNGSKAAKILGLLSKSADGKDSPLIKLPSSAKKAPVKVTELEIELPSKLEPNDDTNASLLSVLTKDTDNSAITTDTQASSTTNLEDQLKSFPKPSNPNALSTTSSSEISDDGRRDTGGSFLTNGSSADEPDEPEPPAPTTTVRSGRPPKAKGEMKKRDPSAHTIQVYLEHDEILEYYNRMRR